MQILNEYRINNEERSIIEWIGVPGRFQSRASSLLRYRTDNTADWTYFDQFYRLNFTGQIGQRTDGTPIMLDRIEGKNEFDVFRDSFKLRIRPERQFYPMHDYVSQLDRNRVRRPLIQQLERVRNIEAIIASVEDAKVDLGPFIFERARNVRTDNSYLDNDYRFVQANTRTNGPRAGTPIYLRDDAESAQAWFRNTLQDFVVRETNCEILPSPGDPDYTRSTEAPASNDVDVCRNRFLGWQRALDALKANASSRN
jgi:hypothetical protein